MSLSRRGFIGSLAALAATAMVPSVLTQKLVADGIARLDFHTYYGEDGELVVEVRNASYATQDVHITLYGANDKPVAWTWTSLKVEAV